MYEQKEIILSTLGYKLYQFLLLLYPVSYRKKFGQEMLILFDEIYQEKIEKDGYIGVNFWIMLVMDCLKSALGQHYESIKNQGMKKYLHKTLHFNNYNIIGGMLLLPFCVMFVIDLLFRILQGDVTHYNRQAYAFISHSPLYWTPVLFTWVILFPALAVLINLIPLIKNVSKNNKTFLSFAKQNIISLTILIIGLGFLAFIKLHDFAPCIMHGLLRSSIGQIPQLFSVCSSA